MKFRTELNIEKSLLKIEHKHKIITIGSCFAENIGAKFSDYRFNILDNPFGVLYNPVSIYNAVKIISDNKIFTEDELIFEQGEWHSFYHHSDFSHHDLNICLSKINSKMVETRKFMSDADEIVITFGTAFVYKYLESGEVVSNCHKIAADKFERYRIGMYEAREFILSTVELLKELKPNIKIILTLSPVRHSKDGFVENQISKSILLLAIQEIVDENDSVFYFPSYEIMLDDLRDYRFYAEDLVHPNKIAIDYIWEKFVETYCTEDCIKLMKEIEKISKGRQHRVRNIHSAKNKLFLQNQLKLITKLENENPHLYLEDDKEYFLKNAEMAEKN